VALCKGVVILLLYFGGWVVGEGWRLRVSCHFAVNIHFEPFIDIYI